MNHGLKWKECVKCLVLLQSIKKSLLVIFTEEYSIPPLPVAFFLLLYSTEKNVEIVVFFAKVFSENSFKEFFL